MGLKDRLLDYSPLCIMGAFLFLGLSIGRVFGSRGDEKIYSFKYKSEPAKLMRENIRLGPDKYFILIGDKDKVAGELTTDDGKRISIQDRFYHGALNGRYDIRDVKN
ncbi:MAG: hypothetical protein PHH54_02705 [Candidatus Nanoarchaeia archaeon]|nr:hypothetical protein [Candidatus Nanoarchaeia archaeon]MDD5740871.1 hypothetical protein [Candidatus Nanoarchaeia archaeon]